jgi:Holliday junction resolvase
VGPEARYQHQLITELRARGAWVVKYPAGPYGTRGTPDLLCCYKGRFLAIECKSERARSKPTAQQTRQLRAIREAGGTALIIYPGGAATVNTVLASLEPS